MLTRLLVLYLCTDSCSVTVTYSILTTWEQRWANIAIVKCLKKFVFGKKTVTKIKKKIIDKYKMWMSLKLIENIQFPAEF